MLSITLDCNYPPLTLSPFVLFFSMAQQQQLNLSAEALTALLQALSTLNLMRKLSSYPHLLSISSSPSKW